MTYDEAGPMNPSQISPAELLNLLPQADPFRFVDRVLEVDAGHIVGQYTFRAEEFYYRGHFPDRPLTPGVILLEALAQCSLVLQGIYLLALEVPREELAQHRALFTNAEIEWRAGVYPGDTVVTRGEVVAWRRRRLRSRAEMRNQKGEIVAFGEIGGMGVQL